MKFSKEKIESIAKQCHEINKRYCELMGDNSQVSWETCPDWQKKSAINGVRFHLFNHDTSPEDSHISWMDEKIDDGWKYGSEKNAELKTHPCIVPYNELPATQRLKDHLFLTICKFHKYEN